MNSIMTSQLSVVAALAGIASATIFFGLNMTINRIVVPIMLLGSPVPGVTTGSDFAPFATKNSFFVPSTETPVSATYHINRQWQEMYWRGHYIGFPSAVFSTVVFLVAGLTTEQWWSPQQALFALAAVTAISVWPFTEFALVPINNVLHARAQAMTGNNAKEDVSAEAYGKVFNEKDTLQLIHNWTAGSETRARIGGTAALLGMAALALSVW